MKVLSTAIPDVLLIVPELYEDERGFFMETYNLKEYMEMGIPEFVQDNHSWSRQGVLRGLHYQIRNAQGKMVRVINGIVFDVVVDLRKSSSTFGKWVGQILSSENKHQLWVPQGFAHGYYVLSKTADFLYKTTDFYAPEWERTILWNDPEISIEWPLLEGKSPSISSRDLGGSLFVDADIFD